MHPGADDDLLQKLYVQMSNTYIDLKRYDEAYQCLSQAVQYDNPIAYNNYACVLFGGMGCEQNSELAIDWFKKAAMHSESPSIESNIHLGKLYLGIHDAAPDFSPVDPQMALFYLERAKALGAENVDELIRKANIMLDL